MRMLLDLGNTRLKWALHSPTQDEWVAQGAVEWQADMAPALVAAWGALPLPEFVAAASVVDSAREQDVSNAVRGLFSLKPQWLLTPANACGVHNAYAEPQRLGVDRFLAMVAAFADQHTPCIIASVGTALTLDALAVDGAHLGGMIAPGPRLMQRSLWEGTARIKAERSGTIVDLADNTVDAVTSGCWQAAAALIERFFERVSPQLGPAATLVLGGGDAAALAPLLRLPVTLSHDAVLRGLAVWANAQLATSFST